MSAKEEIPPFHSSLGFRYPAHRDDKKLCADLWLDDKRMDDGAEGLWRIHDKLYDLTSWIEEHPGGRDWIRLTKGTDVTEAFETYHISTEAKQRLPKFFIRKATSPRNSPYTFHENGFYNTLKTQIRESLKTIPESAAIRSKVMTDMLLAAYIVTAILSTRMNSLIFGAVSGILLSLTTIAAHNFFHQRDNFRMYYFDLSSMSSRDWRISHAMSHHLYTNSVNDLEISLVQPYLWYLPAQNTAIRRIISCIISPFFYVFLFVGNLIKRYILTYLGVSKELNKAELIPYIIPMIMYFVGGRSFIETILMWLWIVTVASFYFGFLGVNAAHHHPEIFHDGDTPRVDRDWGLSQMDAVMDRHEFTGSPFLVLTSFGDHSLHHLFPTLDHGKLDYLYPVFKKTCNEFNVEFRITSQWELMVGQYYQLLRMIPNPLPPGMKWRWYKTVVAELRQHLVGFIYFLKNKSNK